jgi:hypothetical protein
MQQTRASASHKTHNNICSRRGRLSVTKTSGVSIYHSFVGVEHLSKYNLKYIIPEHINASLLTIQRIYKNNLKILVFSDFPQIYA